VYFDIILTFSLKYDNIGRKAKTIPKGTAKPWAAAAFLAKSPMQAPTIMEIIQPNPMLIRNNILFIVFSA